MDATGGARTKVSANQIFLHRKKTPTTRTWHRTGWTDDKSRGMSVTSRTIPNVNSKQLCLKAYNVGVLPKPWFTVGRESVFQPSRDLLVFPVLLAGPNPYGKFQIGLRF